MGATFAVYKRCPGATRRPGLKESPMPTTNVADNTDGANVAVTSKPD